MTRFSHGRPAILRHALPSTLVDQLQEQADVLEALPEVLCAWMKYFESGSDGTRLLNRVENFVDNFPVFQAAKSGVIRELTCDVTNRDLVLLKDKINYKKPEGGGFKPHQDAAAFTRWVPEVFTIAVPLDKCTPDNGAIEVLAHATHERVLPHEGGTIRPCLLAHAQWEHVRLVPGDVMIFAGKLVHRSASNRSSAPRRLFYFTYNDRRLGDFRAKYFIYKRRNFPPIFERTDRSSCAEWVGQLARPIL